MTRRSYQTPGTVCQNDADQRKAREASICAVSAESELPSWVRKHAPCVTKKPKPKFGTRQRKKVEKGDCGLAPGYQPEKLLTVAEVAWLLNLSEKSIRRMVKAGNLAIIRIGRSIRVNPEVIEKIIRQDE